MSPWRHRAHKGILDSGCSRHISNGRENFVTLTEARVMFRSGTMTRSSRLAMQRAQVDCHKSYQEHCLVGRYAVCTKPDVYPGLQFCRQD